MQNDLSLLIKYRCTIEVRRKKSEIAFSFMISYVLICMYTLTFDFSISSLTSLQFLQQINVSFECHLFMFMRLSI